MKFLIDTNIFIPLEPTSIADLEANTDPALEFDQLCSKAGCEIFIHPAISQDIQNDKDASRKALRNRLTLRYSTLRSSPPASSLNEHEIPSAEEGSHDWVDNNLIAALFADLVDYLVTEDAGIHKKAKRIGLDSRVLFLDDAVAAVRDLFHQPSPPPPNVELKYVYQVDSSDPIFDSLRNDYDGFDEWLTRCKRQHRECYVSASSDSSIAGIAIFKSEDRLPDGTKGKTLKVCTFKVSEHHSGNRIGELLLKPVMKYALEGDYDFVYLTTYPKQEGLITFLHEFGFREIGNRDSLYELAFCKELKYCKDDLHQMDPLEFHIKYGPYVTSFVGNQSFVVPIIPEYYSVLFPELAPHPVSLFSQTTKPCGNAIRKAYICNSSIKKIKPGDNLFFYRSKDFSAITCIGIVEGVMRSNNPENIARFVGKRTVYSYSEIEEMCRNHDTLAFLFRLVNLVDPKIPLQTLMANGIMKRQPQSISALKNEGIQWLRQQIGM